MKRYYPGLAILCSLISSHSLAATMDQSGQSVLPFLESGHYFEASITAADPEVSGHTLEPIQNIFYAKVALKRLN